MVKFTNWLNFYEIDLVEIALSVYGLKKMIFWLMFELFAENFIAALSSKSLGTKMYHRTLLKRAMFFVALVSHAS